jgi:hypothetical protein
MVNTSHSWAEPARQEKLPQGGLVPSLFHDKGNILRYIITIQKAFLDPGMHINEEPNMFKLQLRLIQPDQLNMFSSLIFVLGFTLLISLS